MSWFIVPEIYMVLAPEVLWIRGWSGRLRPFQQSTERTVLLCSTQLVCSSLGIVREVKKVGGSSDGNRGFGQSIRSSRAPTLYYYVINCNGDFNWENNPPRTSPFVRSFILAPLLFHVFPLRLRVISIFILFLLFAVFSYLFLFFVPSLSSAKLADEQDLSSSLNSHVARNVLFVVISSAELGAFETV